MLLHRSSHRGHPFWIAVRSCRSVKIQIMLFSTKSCSRHAITDFNTIQAGFLHCSHPVRLISWLEGRDSRAANGDYFRLLVLKTCYTYLWQVNGVFATFTRSARTGVGQITGLIWYHLHQSLFRGSLLLCVMLSFQLVRALHRSIASQSCSNVKCMAKLGYCRSSERNEWFDTTSPVRFRWKMMDSARSGVVFRSSVLCFTV